MATKSKSSLVFLQRLGILEPVAASPSRRICFDSLLINTKPILMGNNPQRIDEVLPGNILNAERSPFTADRQLARVWNVKGAVVVSTVEQ